jgi:predicted Zn-dependent protease
MKSMLRTSLASICALLLVTEPMVYAQNLPDFGSPADSVLSKSREKLLGQSVILQLRNAGAIVDDPQLNEYIRLLGSTLASQVNDGGFDFDFFMINDDTVNAFAMPGGVIGVNTGLLLATDDESELAGVIAHEVSHVTQRHIARALYDQKRGGIMTLATLLAGILLASTGNASGEAVSGVAAASQAAAVQRQINFTRANEEEADRIGMDVLARSGFDPAGMASFFEKLARQESTSPDAVPEMLRTHPTSRGRIAEARGRARQLPRVNHVDSMGYGLAKARVRVLSARRPADAVAYYRLLEDSENPADKYGRALALTKVGLDDQAERIFRELSDTYPSVIAFRIGRAEALMASGLDEQALAVYSEANTLAPRNTPLVISYAEALIQSGRAHEAHRLLLDLLNNVRPAPEQIQLMARAANAEGDLIDAHQYMSEYFASIGDLRSAMSQLRMALESPGVTDIQRARFNARMSEFEEYQAESEE